MFNRIVDKLSGDYNAKQLNSLGPIVDKVNSRYADFDQLSDEDIKAKTQEFKDRLTKGESLDDILPEAFAVVKQACKRMVGKEFDVKGEKQTWNMVPYDVQLLGGIILHRGTIAEMKTGEGKTLVATLPVYLNALTGKGVHVVTVNDYLASRDAERMGHLYKRLGLTIGCVVKGMPLTERKEAYSSDITYVENSELGFDYLRDNLVKTGKDRNLLHRPLNYAIIDEVDSILIDEARTPLIISEPHAEPTEKYEYYAKIVKSLNPSKVKKKVSKGLLHELMNETKKKQRAEDPELHGDYYIDEKTKTAQLSGEGIEKLENILHVNNLYQELGYEEIHHIENALKAQAVYDKDSDYIVKDNKVMIIDQHTGRAMPGRRFSEGLHQAIEAKEGVPIQRESKTIATITYQNFFKQYSKMAGMTGTAVTEAEEFGKIYELEVLSVPTNKPVIRVDQSDKVYFNQKAKWNNITDYITFSHQMGQPILIGTSTIQTSEQVSSVLTENGITHSVLNAKQHEKEAHIVSNAGKYGSVVVATNMAGRGTDIKLDKDLNTRIATNYAKRIQKELDKGNDISAVIYSAKEYELTMDALMAQFDLSADDIRQAEKGRHTRDQQSLQIIFNTKKGDITKSEKAANQAFAEIRIKKDSNQSLIEKDLHYGLFILGTEKHDSRRIDNQLRGRAGRQGDAGFSVFFVALDDLIMRKMGGERIQQMASMLLNSKELETIELTQKQFTNSITRAQKQIEGRHFSVRKHLFDYDNVIDRQRKRIYTKRDEILASETDEKTREQFVHETQDELYQYIKEIIVKQTDDAKKLQQSKDDFFALVKKELRLNIADDLQKKRANTDYDTIAESLITYLNKYLKDNFASLSTDKQYIVIKQVYLHNLDKLRIDHIDEMHYLREKVSLMGYAQMDPLVVYKKEAFEKFQSLLYRFKYDTTAAIMSLDFAALKQQEEAAKVIADVQQQEGGEQTDYLDILQQAANSKAVKELMQKQTQQPKKVISSSSDDIEVFEVSDNKPNNQAIQEPIDLSKKKKLRPNDKVNIKYQDGRIEYSVKYKKVEDDIKNGKATIV